MSIPINIESEHVFQALVKIKREGITPNRGPRNWVVNYEGEIFLCKLLISWANIYVNGYELDFNPNIFTTNNA